MDMETLGNLGSIAQAIFTPLFILFAVMEVRRARKESEVQSYYSTVEMMISLDQYFIEHPEYRAYIYQGKPFNKEDFADDEAQYEQLMAVAEMMVDYFDLVLQQIDIMEVDRATAWVNYVLTTGENSPLIRHFMLENSEWYIDCLVDMLVSGVYNEHKPHQRQMEKRIVLPVTHGDGAKLDRIRAELKALRSR